MPISIWNRFLNVVPPIHLCAYCTQHIKPSQNTFASRASVLHEHKALLHAVFVHVCAELSLVSTREYLRPGDRGGATLSDFAC